MDTISYSQILKNLREISVSLELDKLDTSLLDIILFLVKEDIIPLIHKVVKIKKTFSFKNKYNKMVFDIAKNVFFYNNLKIDKPPMQINNLDRDTKQISDNMTILQNLQNLISYDEYIGNSNLVDIIVPMCKTEPPNVTKSDICDCDYFTYDELSRKEIDHKYDEIVPKLPADRGIIKYLNALLGVICLIDKRNKIIDYKLFFEAIQKDLHYNNNTNFENYYSIYDSLNVDMNKFSQEIGVEKMRKMLNYVNKIKNIESKFNSELSKLNFKNKNKNKKKSKKRGNILPMNHLRNVLDENSNTSNNCNKYDNYIKECNKKGNFFTKKKKRNSCLLASEFKKRCRKSKHISKRTKRSNLKKCIKRYAHELNISNSNATVKLEHKHARINPYKLNNSVLLLQPELGTIKTPSPSPSPSPITFITPENNYISIAPSPSPSFENSNLSNLSHLNSNN
jgi:hypothetical protein